jgi:radical SAM superfamily enzyme YgiQ (UPF0313 family)
MAEILLISPPFGDVYGIDLKKKQLGVPPIGLATLGGYLQSKGHNVTLLDMVYFDGGLGGLKKTLKEKKPDFVGLSSTTPQMNSVFSIAGHAKRHSPKSRVIVGGPHVSASPKETLMECPDIDYVVFGEGEEATDEILSGINPNDIKGLAFRKKNTIRITGRREPIRDLDSLPYPLYDQMPLQYYGHPLLGKSIGLMSGRGCPFQCTFCASNVVHGRGYRTRSVEKIVEEIEMLIDKYGFRTFSFWDDTFTCNTKRVFEFCNLLMKKRLDIKWSCGVRVNTFSEKMLKSMKKSGCVMLFVGYESGNDRILELCQKRATVKQAIEFSKVARKVGIPVCGYFIIGLPFETEETIMQTINFARNLGIDYAQFAVLMPLPGTAVWRMAEHNEGITFLCKDWKKFSRYQKPVIELEDVSSEQLFRYYKMAYRKFYLHPGYFWNRIKGIRSLSDIRQLISNARLFRDFL